ncbi:MAG: hypothetical protein A2Z72_05750 [Omnitrophica bacterium RBG_13_46_9]|nr:MAG: hypothetical protein A2Z72_05750 [Omnitrophica bacterium RBG_13_46_9]
MKLDDVNIFRCPKCKSSLKLSHCEPSQVQEEIMEGWLACSSCGKRYQIIKSIPRFVDSAGYAASFGYQWKKFARTQVGDVQKKISKIRFDATTKWPGDLRGQLVLEAGCGAGRFSEIALDTGAIVYSFEISEAIEANLDNVKAPELRKRHHLFQTDIYEIPLPYGMFDKIFCMGVLQHCPDVKKAYLSLMPFLKPGGELVVDCYLSQPFKHIFNLKYRLRPFFKWWKPSRLFTFWSFVISIAYDIKSLCSKIPFIGALLSNLIPIGRLNYEPDYHLSVPELKEIKTLSVFDMLSPKYDKPQRLSSFRRWMEEGGLEILGLTTGYNGINARARRPADKKMV